MAGKRQFDSNNDNDEPKSKRMALSNVRVNIGGVTSLEELDTKTLLFQNNKLYEKLESYRQEESEYVDEIESLKAKQAAAEATLSLINRYWDQLDDYITLELQRIGKKDENEIKIDEDEKKQTFRRLLKDFEFKDIKDNVANRLNSSRQLLGKVVDGILKQKTHYNNLSLKLIDSNNLEAISKIFNAELRKENESLISIQTSLQTKHDDFLLEKAAMKDKEESQEERIADLQEDIQNAKWELKKARGREEKLNHRLNDYMNQINNGTLIEESNQPSSTSTDTTSKNNDEKNSTDEWKILAEGRMAQLVELKTLNIEVMKQNEKQKLQLKNISESVIINSPEYKTLQSQFSVLYHESIQLKNLLDESRQMYHHLRFTHARKVEQLECEEIMKQQKLRNELIQSESIASKARNDYDLLHSELKQNLAANEQAGPVNREMRHMINSLRNQNFQLKSEGQRYKKKCKEFQNEINKLRQQEKPENKSSVSKESSNVASSSVVKHEESSVETTTAPYLAENEDLKSQLKCEETKVKELKCLLEAYKNLSADQREKAEVIASEKKSLLLIEELKEKLAEESRKCVDMKNEEQFERVNDSESSRKIKALEESVSDLRRNLAATKQEEEALLSEMDVTGTAFEDMQEQNMRLLQQLREKDDANFKLMSERIKSNKIHKLLQEEKALIESHSATLTSQVEAQNVVIRKLEEKDRLMHGTLVNIERENNLRLQMADINKRKAIEAAQAAEDARREMNKYKEKVQVLEDTVEKNIESLEEERFKISRIQVERF